MVKRSKGKSIRGAKWFGQEQVFSETRGKPAECDPTRGIKSIIPFLSTWLSQPDAGAQEPDATVDDDSYYTEGAYYYVQPADDDQE